MLRGSPGRCRGSCHASHLWGRAARLQRGERHRTRHTRQSTAARVRSRLASPLSYSGAVHRLSGPQGPEPFRNHSTGGPRSAVRGQGVRHFRRAFCSIPYLFPSRKRNGTTCGQRNFSCEYGRLFRGFSVENLWMAGILGSPGDPIPGSRQSHMRQQLSWWAKEVSNLRPPACKAGALPLSYSPGTETMPIDSAKLV